jgi:hypothetical protein
MTKDEIKGALSWLGGAESPWTNNEGVTILSLHMPEPQIKALQRHLTLLLEASDPKGMVFEVRDDRLVVDGVEFVVPPDQVAEHSRTGLLSVVMMRLARMYNIVRMWEGD